MRLAFALFRYFPYGGLQRDMLNIARACLARGHQVRVLTREWQGDRSPGLEVERLPVRGWTNHGRDRRFAEAMRAQVAAGRYDAVVGFNKMPGLDIYYAADSCFAAKLAESRGPLYRATARARTYLSLERAVFAPASGTRVLMISAAEQQVYQRYYGLAEERMALLPPGIRRDRAMPADYGRRREATRSAMGLGPQQRLLLFVGSGFRTKGLDRAIRTVAALPQALRERCQLWVVGQDRPGRFAALAGRLGVLSQVHFAGGRDDIPELLWAADLLLHPAYRENTGTVLLEAMIAGLPVATTAACGYAGYVAAAEMGAVAPQPFSQSAFVQSVTTLLGQPRELWRERGARFAEQADIYCLVEHAVDRIEQWSGAHATVSA